MRARNEKNLWVGEDSGVVVVGGSGGAGVGKLAEKSSGRDTKMRDVTNKPPFAGIWQSQTTFGSVAVFFDLPLPYSLEMSRGY